MSDDDLRRRALDLYYLPFRYEHGYIWDNKTNMVADAEIDSDIGPRIRGWGRMKYLPKPDELYDETGRAIAEAMTIGWEAMRTRQLAPTAALRFEDEGPVVQASQETRKAIAMLTRNVGRVAQKHDWQCIAPEGGFYRWTCKRCPASRPHPSASGPDDEECPGNLAPPVQVPKNPFDLPHRTVTELQVKVTAVCDRANELISPAAESTYTLTLTRLAQILAECGVSQSVVAQVTNAVDQACCDGG